ncbi:Crp/Fnr family transcriptional regulator [Pinibacter soli]|uniref:Crp/Fnr family transcriptional regulator n=1 Tax=Pinibacter soli TaxID=3044211 RepID=A0ABT6RGU3_9BACT|nr:Crp/Fnr family transcriptional regulator [Pinibacter soli]MDI3321792.1 Crp/Fnr family transcriptional regulator [Pinibacter soli]
MPPHSNHTQYKIQLFHYLRRFDNISPEQLDIIQSYLEVRTFDKKQIVVNKGEVDNHFNIVIKGLVRKYFSLGKKEITLQLATEGHFIHSEISFIQRTPSDMIVETLEPTILVSISHDSMNSLLDTHPQFEHLARLLISDMYIKKNKRYYSQSLISTRERFLEYLQNHPDMLQRVPQKYLASYLNIKPETFSRLKHLLKTKK